MQTDYSVFPERLAEACRARNLTRDKLCTSIGMGGRQATNFLIQGLKAVDLYRVCQIADRLDVSLDWLLGRSPVMDLPKPPAKRRA
jgi:transcriptional regulator with XRE-family HTH domain